MNAQRQQETGEVELALPRPEQRREKVSIGMDGDTCVDAAVLQCESYACATSAVG